MAYPIVPNSYGFKPVNLIGGQVFAGSTRNLPIAYGYSTNIFYGDFVILSRGFVTRASVTNASSGQVATGIFLGCTYTNPTTKQKQFSQYWPASTLAGDAQAIICDDPDTVFKVVVLANSTGTNVNSTPVGSGSLAIVGQNIAAVSPTTVGNVNTGDSYIGVLAQTSTPATSSLPIRVIDVVRDTAQSYSATGSSSGTTITLTGTGLPATIQGGTDVAYVAANGQLIETGSYVNNASGYTSGATSIVINQQPIVLGSGADIPSSSTIVFTQYPEILVKINFGAHAYYASVANA